jgi:hypothetical protein
MSSQAIMTLPLSRPKVHRPPALRDGAPDRRPLLLLVAGVSLLALAISKVSSAPQQIEQAAPMTEMKTAIEQAQSVEPTPAAPAKSSDTIVIEEGNQAIIGQMARIPTQNKTATDIRTVTSLDKEDGKELLSIVNKY